MQSVSSRIWTRIAVFISYGDNDYTTGTSIILIFDSKAWNHLTVAYKMINISCILKQSKYEKYKY